MSGICAVWQKRHPLRGAETLASVSWALALDSCEHAQGFMDKDADVGVGVCARFPGQLVYQSPRLLLACDADLYNEAEIGRLLGRSVLLPHAETAAAMAGLYERFGTHFLEKLRGEFSVIIWDRTRRVLIAATDGFGIRPLVYYEDERLLIVSSRIDALLATGHVPKEIEPRAVANHLNYLGSLAPTTIIANVFRLLPGTFMLASASLARTQRYWDMSYTSESRGDTNTLCRQLESVVEESVKSHCKIETFSTLGAFLSGGVDSSTVVGMMSRLERGPPKAFSIGFHEERYNELQYARIAASEFGADHHEYLVTAEDCIDVIPALVRCFDEPLTNPSAIATYFCARLAAQQGVRALLAGDGGDELFGGNEHYFTDRVLDVYQHIPKLLRKGLIEPALAFIPLKNYFLDRARSYVRRSNLPQPERFFSYNLLMTNSLGEIFDNELLSDLQYYSILQIPSQYYWEGPAQHHLDRLLYLDVKIVLGDNDLLKVTRMSELAGVRPRFPLLDRSVAEVSAMIPACLKVRGWHKRYLFKRAFRELLPPEVIRKKKHGFGVPVALWTKSNRRMREIARDILLSRRTYERGYFRRCFMEDVFQKHETDNTIYYGGILWMFLALELWFRESIDGTRVMSKLHPHPNRR